MLKSLATQFAATLFLGPLGLAYSSMAAAVFLSLVLAVLYFTVLGPLAIVVIWPIAIIVGLLLVKMHNDQIRSSGSRLLLGPDEEEPALSALGSGSRAIAVLGLLAAVGYFAFWYNPDDNSTAADQLADATQSGDSLAGNGESTNSADFIGGSSGSFAADGGGNADSELAIAETFPINDGGVIGSSSERLSGSIFSAVTDRSDSEPVIVDSSSQPVASQSQSSSGNRLYVDSELVNLREGPGTNFSILTTVGRGVGLSEIDRAGRWLQVVSDTGATGWIFERLVSEEPN